MPTVEQLQAGLGGFLRRQQLKGLGGEINRFGDFVTDVWGDDRGLTQREVIQGVRGWAQERLAFLEVRSQECMVGLMVEDQWLTDAWPAEVKDVEGFAREVVLKGLALADDRYLGFWSGEVRQILRECGDIREVLMKNYQKWLRGEKSEVVRKRWQKMVGGLIQEACEFGNN